VTVPYRLVSASTAMVLMAVPPEDVVTVVRLTPPTLGHLRCQGFEVSPESDGLMAHR
jgi:hypothetical protein